MALKSAELELEELKQRLLGYEQNGVAKLYYALNRKANEMADLLNKVNLADINLGDKDNKTFERMKVVWNDSASISNAIKELGTSFGITNDEEKDINKKPFNDRIAESRN